MTPNKNIFNICKYIKYCLKYYKDQSGPPKKKKKNVCKELKYDLFSIKKAFYIKYCLSFYFCALLVCKS